MIIRSDGEIEAAVFDELAWDAAVTSTEIDVDVHHRIVTLSGTVRTPDERRAAEVATLRLSGVLAVVNELHVGETPKAPRS